MATTQAAPAHDLKRPTFILSAGAAKAGTSWLATYLSSHPQVATPQMKEFHVLNYIFCDNKRTAKQKERRKQLQAARLNPLTYFGQRNDAQVFRHNLQLIFRLTDSIDAYQNYFSSLVSKTVPVTYDFTPNYCILSAEEFSRVRDIMHTAGFNVKVIFLMRDPVDRIWSQVRMLYASGQPRSVRSLARHLLYPKAKAGLTRYINDPRVDYLTRYDLTMSALEDAFAPDEIWMGFYETLFQQATIDDLCAFIGLTPRPADFETRVNRSASADGLTETDKQRLRRTYDVVYQACSDKFGENHIKSIWPSYCL